MKEVEIVFEEEKYRLFPHQEKTKKWINDRFNIKPDDNYGINGVIIANKMGLGKTLSALDYTKDVHPNLVVLTTSALTVWEKEIKERFPDKKFLIMRKDECSEYATMSIKKFKKYQWILINYEALRIPFRKFEKRYELLDSQERKIGVFNCNKPNPIGYEGIDLIFNYPFEYVIADECHKMDNPKGKTFYSVMGIYGKRKIGLTGDPVRNYFSDIYTKLRFIGYNEECHHKRFTQEMYIEGNFNENILRLTYESEDIKMPELKENIVKIDLEGREREIYKYYLNDAREKYNEFLIGGTTYAHILAIFGRLSQICIVPYTILQESARNYKGRKDQDKYDEAQKVLDKMTNGLSSWLHQELGTSGVESAKVKLLIEDISKIKEGKILIFSRFKRVSDIIAKAIKEKLKLSYLFYDGDTGKNKRAVLDTFENSDKTRILICTTKTGAESLNLTIANHVFLMGAEWTFANGDQAIARVHRIGQTKDCFVTRYLVNDSVEERMDELCAIKKQLKEDIIGNQEGMGSVQIGRMLNRREKDD